MDPTVHHVSCEGPVSIFKLFWTIFFFFEEMTMVIFSMTFSVAYMVK